MDLRVVALPDSPRWEPNAPNASLVTSDETGVSQLRLRAHPDDPDQSLVIIEWVGAVAATMASPNDEGRHEHPLYHSGLDALLWMGEVVGPEAGGYRSFVVPLKESTVEVVARAWSTRREPQRPLLTVGYWDTTGGSRYPNPVDLIDVDWDEDERFDVMSYLEHAPVARTYMGYSPCRICGSDNGNLELTDGTFIWPDGLVHYVRDHAVRLPEAFVGHVRQQLARWDYAASTTEWWSRQFDPAAEASVDTGPAAVPGQLVGRELVLGQLDILQRELDADPDSWENPSLGRYLEAFGALLGCIEHSYRNTGRVVPESAWQICADALAGAKSYE